MKRTLIILAALLSGCASFDDTWIVGPVAWSYHEDRDKPHRESHALIGIEHPVSRTLRLAGGGFINSKDDTSLYGGVLWLPLGWCDGTWRAGALAMMVTGYDPENPWKLAPFLSPALAYERKHWGVDLLTVGEVTMLLLKLRF